MNYFAYFSEIEQSFVRRRARNLLLSPLDWALIESWKERGVPLFVVLRAIDAVFDSIATRDEHAARKRPIKSLLYCRDEVENQYAAWLDAQVGTQTNAQTESQSIAAIANGNQSNHVAAPQTGARVELQNETANSAAETQTDATFSQTQILEHIKRLREHFAGENAILNGSWAKLSERVRVRLRQAETEFLKHRDAAQLETALDELDQKIDEILNKIFDAARFAEIEQQTAQQLRAFKRQMPPAAFAQTHRALLIKNLREAADLPRFSLFYL